MLTATFNCCSSTFRFNIARDTDRDGISVGDITIREAPDSEADRLRFSTREGRDLEHLKDRLSHQISTTRATDSNRFVRSYLLLLVQRGSLIN